MEQDCVDLSSLKDYEYDVRLNRVCLTNTV